MALSVQCSWLEAALCLVVRCVRTDRVQEEFKVAELLLGRRLLIRRLFLWWESEGVAAAL